MSRLTIRQVLPWALTLGSGAILLWAIDLRDVPGLLAATDPLHLSLALLIALAHFFVGAWRWQQLLALFGASTIPYIRLFNLYLASFFVSSVLPGTITGDGLRVYETRREVGGPTTALAIVLLERLLGITVLCVAGAIAWLLMPLHPLLQVVLPRWEYVLIPLIGGVLLAGAGALTWPALTNRVAGWLRQFAGQFLQLPSLVVARPLVSLKALAGTFVYQALSISIVFEALRATGVPLSFQLFLTVVPVVTVLLILPISVQGVGVRESLFLAFLVPYGLEPEPIVAGLALTYMIGVPFIFWGWLLFSRMARREGAPPDV